MPTNELKFKQNDQESLLNSLALFLWVKHTILQAPLDAFIQTNKINASSALKEPGLFLITPYNR